MKRHLKAYLFAGLMTALMAVSALAQTRPGSIHGVVSSAAGAVIIQAQIIFRNQLTGTTKIVQTDENGAYAVNEITPGDYEVKVAASGFHPQSQRVTVEPDGHITLDFSLEPLAEAEEKDKSGEEPGEPGAHFVTSTERITKLNLTAIAPIMGFLTPFSLGGSYTSRNYFDPGGILVPTRNEYAEDKSGTTDRLGKAIRAAKPDGRR